jgi:hypothetical protein
MVSERIHVPKTFIVFGIFLNVDIPPQTPPESVSTPRSFFLARRFCFVETALRCPGREYLAPTRKL